MLIFVNNHEQFVNDLNAPDQMNLLKLQSALLLLIIIK